MGKCKVISYATWKVPRSWGLEHAERKIIKPV